MRTRIGQGFDVHAFGPGDHLYLGGVRIPHSQGLEAHSDGDVALHALCDALLGAAALGDLGSHFPPGDDQWRDASSRNLLTNVVRKIRKKGWQVSNCDITIICEQPRVSPHVDEMRAIIAADEEIESSGVSVKATTTEKLGFCGRGEGIAALAVVQLEECGH